MNKEQLSKIICKTHEKCILLVCSNELCNQKRLICSGCIQKSTHIAHQQDLKELEFLPENIKNTIQQCSQFTNKLQDLMKDAQQTFEHFIKTIDDYYNIFLQQLPTDEYDKINQQIDMSLKFDNVQKQLFESVSQTIQDFQKKVSDVIPNIPECNELISKDFYQKGLALYWEKKDYIEAINLLNKSLVYDANNVSSISLKGSCLRQSNNFFESIELYNQALKSTPNHVPSLSGKGLSLRLQGKFDESIVLYKQALSNDQNHVNSLIGVAESLRMQEKYPDSLEWYDKVLYIEPTNVYTLAGKGCSLRMMDNFEEAIKWYDKALNVEPENSFSLSGKGDCLRMLNMYQEALKCFDKVLANDLNNYFCLGSKGACLISMENFAESKIHLQKSIEIKPDYEFSKDQLKRCTELERQQR